LDQYARGADFLDFVWLQLIKLKAPSLHEWTQVYLTSIGAYRDGGRPGDTEPQQYADRLFKIMEELDWHRHGYHSGIGAILPGVDSFLLEGDKRKVFEFQHAELATFEQSGRLGSPSHWRQYFAFDLPSYALSDEEIAEFKTTAIQDVSAAAEILRQLVARPHPRRGHFLDVLLDRLLDSKNRSLSPREMIGIGSVFAVTMDEVAVETSEIQSFGSSDIWRKATRLLGPDVAPNFQTILATGESINWLANVVRDQAFAHGLPRGDRSDPSRQWLDKNQLDTAIVTITERFRRAGARNIFRRPEPLDILFCWHQLGNAEEVRTVIQAATKEDDVEFLSALNAMRGWLSSSTEGVRYPLRRQTVEQFLDADVARARLETLANSETTDTSLQLRARELLNDWTDKGH
jgi:hypothetical protein